MTATSPAVSNRRSAIPFIVLIVSLVITASATVQVMRAERMREFGRFEYAVERTQMAIQRRIETYTNLLRGATGLFYTKNYVSRDQFHAYVQPLELPKRYPGLQGIGVSGRIPYLYRDAGVQRMRSEGFPSFSIRPDYPRAEYHPALYLEPLDDLNRVAIGYDMFTEPVRRVAMESARDSGAATTTGKLTLVQEPAVNPQAGFIIYVPAYFGGDVPTTVDERRKLLGGFIYAVFRADDLLHGILGDDTTNSGAVFKVFDGENESPQAMLHNSAANISDGYQSRFTKTLPLDVPGRRWTIQYRSSPQFDAGTTREFTLLVPIAGTIISLLLFSLTATQSRSQRTAERIAAELRTSESALRLSEGKFRRLADSNLIGIAFTTTTGKIIDGNDEYFRIIGRTRQEALAGKLRWNELTAPEYRHLDERASKQLHDNGVAVPYEKQYEHPDGSRMPALVGAAALEGPDDESVAFVLDLTTRKAAEKQMQHAKDAAETANRLKDEFLATVSHELRTPLNAILGWAQLLRSGRADKDDIAHGVETIERNAKAQAHLVEDLLDISRIVAGKLRLEMQSVDVAALVQASVAAIRQTADVKRVEMVTHIDAETGRVLADDGRLQQVVWNLLSNAVKFTPSGGRVEIRLHRNERQAQLIVSDNGRGISREFLPYVFEQFRQADASITRKYGGLGLGLGIARHLVELHGGEISADSQGEGTGATFTVTLPLEVPRPWGASPSASPGEIHAADSQVSLSGVRVLAVDDDADSLELIVELLSKRGAEVTTASSAAQAMEIIAANPPHVLISDIGMPVEDGYSLIRRIRALEKDASTIPAIALTAFARTEDRHRALSAGYQVHQPKPLDGNDLAAVVATLAGKSAALAH